MQNSQTCISDGHDEGDDGEGHDIVAEVQPNRESADHEHAGHGHVTAAERVRQ